MFNPIEKSESSMIEHYEPNTSQSAIKQMARDYEYLKEKVLRMQQKLDESNRDKDTLEKQLDALKTENVKFVSDINIMKSEHSEIMHTMSKVERRLDQLERENWYFRSVIQSKNPITNSVDRQITLTEVNDTHSDMDSRMYIRSNEETETRFMPFKPNNGITTWMSSENLNISNFSSSKPTNYQENRPLKKRFLIPKPDSRMTAEFKPSSHL